ncbi:DMT family transporter [Devosia rhodophyticola]|uniref:DMT family transporter n=1 Tax=Devosia rhodophyticola TaxID=3026423 RepID=A0ABY7YV76_9HYPH|nr:DMT family transporter [Devosia rhodophyticola]WDR05092.1 DMT family transporter [Devosia rhodophyticola]
MNAPLNAVLPGENHTRAILLTITTVMIFGMQDAVAKVLVQTYSPFQITMMRYWAFAAFSLFLVSRRAPLRHALRSRVPVWQIVRGVLLMADIWLFALALQSVPLAELQSISLIYPLLVTLFAIPILGEKVGIFRLVTVGVGFMGALFIVRPGGLPMNVGVVYAVASASFYALYIVFTRKVAQHDSAPTSMVYASVIGLVLSGIVGVFHWQPMGWGDVLLVILIMGTTTAAHGLMMVALSMAPASVVQPFNYFSLPWAIFLSFAVFGHLIDLLSLGGAAIIVAAGLVVMARERMRRVPRGQPTVPH